MFTRSLLSAAAILSTFAFGCQVAAPGEEAASSEAALDSTYSSQTDLGSLDEQCRNERSSREWNNWTCAGLDGYELVVGEGYGRERLSIRTLGAEFDVGVLNKIPEGGFVGPKAEWRPTSTPGTLGLVFRYKQPNANDAKRSSLVVAKVTRESACVYAVVDGAARQEAHGHIASDAFTAFSCPVTRPRPAPPATECGVLRAGTGIPFGGALTSCQGLYSLQMQEDGNLVLYRNTDGRALWDSKTNGSRGTGAFLEPDGTFAVYADSWDPNAVWSAKTTGNLGAWLAVQDDGNLVIYSASNRPIWQSRTVQ